MDLYWPPFTGILALNSKSKVFELIESLQPGADQVYSLSKYGLTLGSTLGKFEVGDSLIGKTGKINYEKYALVGYRVEDSTIRQGVLEVYDVELDSVVEHLRKKVKNLKNL